MTAHDGFTLHDLVSYNDKHNEANGEDNRDGESHNRSWNHGVEGPTDDGEILALRERQKRNFLTTLLLSQGVPMIAHGDELGRTQGGNNNVYCPGQRAQLGRLGRRPRPRACSPSSPRGWPRCVPRIPSSAASGSSRAARSAAPASTTSPGCAPTGSTMTDDGLDGGHAQSRGDLPQRPRHPRPRRARRADRRRLVPAADQRPPPAGDVRPARRGLRGGLGGRRRHRRPPARPHPPPAFRAR